MCASRTTTRDGETTRNDSKCEARDVDGWDWYWITCAPGLEDHLRMEWNETKKDVQGTDQHQDSRLSFLPGGLRVACDPVHREEMRRAMMEWKTADNVYAYVCEDEQVGVRTDEGLHAVARTATSQEWNRALDIHRHWTKRTSTVDAMQDPRTSQRKDAPSTNSGGPTDDGRLAEEEEKPRTHDTSSESPGTRGGASGVGVASAATTTFRVTCERTNETTEKHRWTSVQAAAKLGEALLDRFPWKVSLEYFDLEVKVWVRDEKMVVALSLLYAERSPNDTITDRPVDTRIADRNAKGQGACITPPEGTVRDPRAYPEASGSAPAEPPKRRKVDARKGRRNADGRQLYTMARRYRSALAPTSLRPSIAYCLCRLADVRATHLLLDPMAGCGTIPLEGHYGLGVKGSMAGDVECDAVRAARYNGLCLERHHGLSSPDVLQWDVKRLPLRSGCVDRAVCDMPFGNLCGRVKHRFPLYLSALHEIGRVLRPGTGRAVVLIQSRKVHDLLFRVGAALETLDVLPLEMNGLKVSMCLLRRRHAMPRGTP